MSFLASMVESKQRSKAEQSLSVHIPLSEAGLCVELRCGAVFNATHYEACPACGCRQVVLLASWIEPLQGKIEEARWTETIVKWRDSGEKKRSRPSNIDP